MGSLNFKGFFKGFSFCEYVMRFFYISFDPLDSQEGYLLEIPCLNYFVFFHCRFHSGPLHPTGSCSN